MYYNLVRDETQDLFRLGKEMKKDSSVDAELLHTLLSSISTPKPKTDLKGLITWIGLCNKHKLSTPQWMMEAYEEGKVL